MAALFSSAAKYALRLLALAGVMALSTGRATFAQAVAARLPHIELKTTGNLWDAAWSPDGAMLALAIDKSIWLYSDTLSPIAHLDGHMDDVYSLSWRPDGQQLASGGHDNTIRIWDMRPGNSFGKLVKTLKTSDWTANLAWSPDGTRLASIILDRSLPPVDGTIPYEKTLIWNLSTDDIERVLPSLHTSIGLAWKPNSHLLANTGSGIEDDIGPGIRVWDTDTSELQYAVPIGGEKTIYDIDWNPDGRLLAIASDWPFVLVMDANIRDYTMELEGLGSLTSVAWKPDGKQIAAGDNGGSLGIWDVSTAQMLAEINQAHNSLIKPILWHPSGNKLATISSEDNTLRIWDTSGIVSPTGLPTTTSFPTPTPTD
jgi:WD40 repeat protein